MSVVVSSEEVGTCQQQLEVAVPAPAVEAETERVVNELRRRARIPGFRPGKVPSHVIRTQFAEDIRQELIDRLLPRYWRQAEAEAEIVPMLPPQVQEVDLEEDGTLRFVATVETRPRIELGSLENFALPDVPIDPDEEEIERALQDVQKEISDWVDVERAGAQGDRVEGELIEVVAEPEESVGDEAPSEAPSPPEPQRIQFEIGDSRVWEELSLAATGQKPGKSVEFDRKAGEGAEATPRRYRLVLDKIQEKDLLPLDDALAERAGEFADFAALRTEVVGRIRAAKRQDRRSQRERAMLDELRERHPLELPAGVVQREVESLMREYAEGLMMRGVNVETAEIDWQQLGEQLQPQANRRVHARLLLDAVADAEDVKVEAAELESALADIARSQRQTTAALRQQLDNNGGLERLRDQLKHDKVIRRLIGDEESEAAEPADETEDEEPTG